jgi:uncharacterized damage-inducible protein DinB
VTSVHPRTADSTLLDALLDSWDRNNRILVNLLSLTREEHLDARPVEGSPTVGELFMHVHYVRLVFVLEDAREFAKDLPPGEWDVERDRHRMIEMLNESAAAVRDAVRGRLAAGRPMDQHYDHPILMLQHLIWHEGYHHGQIKLTLKLHGHAISNDEAGPLTWSVWMRKH